MSEVRLSMSSETYERQIDLVEVYKKLAEAEDQITEGKPLLDGEMVFQKLRIKHARVSV